MASKKKNRRKVLAASCILAALIVGSSSFAWFTSKDEVVNKLSASNEYNVTVYEDFTPPPSWTPGQTVKKEVSVVNTGNIDAFIKLSLSSNINITKYDSTGDSSYDEDNTDKYITLTDTQVKSLQAGGRLVYNADEEVTDEEDKIVGTEFTPTESGFYVFERNNSTDEKYVGFYFVAGEEADDNVYYAITVTKEDEFAFEIDKTVTITPIGAPKMTYIPADKGDETIDTDDVPAYIKVEYIGIESGTDDDIVINIALDEDELANWTPYDDTTNIITQEFFYNKVLEAGTSTGNLITSVELDESVSNDAFISMDYNLTVTVDSAQVVDTDTDRQSNPIGAVEAVNSQGWNLTATFDAGTTAEKNDDTVSWATPTAP